MSVVVPTYNRATRLAALLRCLEEQPAPSSFEVLVCDDGSSDDTRKVAEMFGRRLRLRYLHQPDEGFRAGAARNMGLDAATGDLVLFLDDDQLVAPDFLDAHRRAHRDAGVPALVIGPRHRADVFDRPPASAERVRAYPQDSRAGEIGADGEGLAASAHPWAHAFSCNLSLPRAAAAARFDEAFSGWGLEDVEFAYRVIRDGLRPVSAPGAPTLHVDGGALRDPFETSLRGGDADFGPWVRNAARFHRLHGADPAVDDFVRHQFSFFVHDATTGRWRRDPLPRHDPAAVLARERRRVRGSAATRTRPIPRARKMH